MNFDSSWSDINWIEKYDSEPRSIDVNLINWKIGQEMDFDVSRWDY